MGNEEILCPLTLVSWGYINIFVYEHNDQVYGLDTETTHMQVLTVTPELLHCVWGETEY
jgi:hypothetical protein